MPEPGVFSFSVNSGRACGPAGFSLGTGFSRLSFGSLMQDQPRNPLSCSLDAARRYSSRTSFSGMRWSRISRMRKGIMTRHSKTTRPSDVDLHRNPLIGGSKGVTMAQASLDDLEDIEGEN